MGIAIQHGNIEEAIHSVKQCIADLQNSTDPNQLLKMKLLGYFLAEIKEIDEGGVGDLIDRNIIFSCIKPSIVSNMQFKLHLSEMLGIDCILSELEIKNFKEQCQHNISLGLSDKKNILKDYLDRYAKYFEYKEYFKSGIRPFNDEKSGKMLSFLYKEDSFLEKIILKKEEIKRSEDEFKKRFKYSWFDGRVKRSNLLLNKIIFKTKAFEKLSVGLEKDSLKNDIESLKNEFDSLLIEANFFCSNDLNEIFSDDFLKLSLEKCGGSKVRFDFFLWFAKSMEKRLTEEDEKAYNQAYKNGVSRLANEIILNAKKISDFRPRDGDDKFQIKFHDIYEAMINLFIKSLDAEIDIKGNVRYFMNFEPYGKKEVNVNFKENNLEFEDPLVKLVFKEIITGNYGCSYIDLFKIFTKNIDFDEGLKESNRLEKFGLLPTSIIFSSNVTGGSIKPESNFEEYSTPLRKLKG